MSFISVYLLLKYIYIDEFLQDTTMLMMRIFLFYYIMGQKYQYFPTNQILIKRSMTLAQIQLNIFENYLTKLRLSQFELTDKS